MALNEEQQELLHAWVDGETNVAEDQVAEQLLQREETREEAQVYVEELRRLRKLVQTHAPVRLPEGLHEKVLLVLRQQDTPDEDNVIAFPFTWRSALMAVAALLILVLGLAFGPSLIGPMNDPEVSGIASGRAPDNRSVEYAAPETTSGMPAPDAPSVESAPLEQPMDEVVREKDLKGPGQNGVTGEQPEAERELQVLRLNRGDDAPFEISVNMDRRSGVSTLSAYNDMLIVSSLYGDADLLASDTQPEEAFAGHDFTAYDGVEVELHREQLDALVGALDRLAKQQDYGELVVPNDLQRDVAHNHAMVEELQDIQARLKEAQDGGSVKRTRNGSQGAPVQGYLPPKVLERKLGRLDRDDDADRDADLRRQLEGAQESGHWTDEDRAETRKVKLLIRLR